MDISALLMLLKDNFFVNFLATAALNGGIAAWKNRMSKHDIFWQLINCMQEAHFDTCEKLGWEYNPDAFSAFFTELDTLSSASYSEEVLATTFVDAIGHPMDTAAIKCFILNFQIHLTLKKHEQLREFFKIHLQFEQYSISNIQKKYVDRFCLKRSLDGIHFFSLSELYMPNEYIVGNTSTIHSDLLELVNNLRHNKVTEFLKRKGIHGAEEIFALFVTGHQCTGKSALVSKLVFDYTENRSTGDNSLYVVSFEDKTFCNEDFNITNICEYLCIKKKNLQDATLLVDGLDESHMSSSMALSRTEELIYALREINCKLIVTSRPHFVFTSELRFSAEIILQPFSERQAIEWLNMSESLSTSSNLTALKHQIRGLTPEMKNIILIPYILQICVARSIDISGVTGVPKLYDIIWGGERAEFSDTPYNFSPRNRVQEWRRFQKEITQISIEHLNSLDNPIPIVEFSTEIFDPTEDKLINTEFFLFTKDNQNYSFVHDSIPQYFVARHIYETVTTVNVSNHFQNLLSEICNVLGRSSILSVGITGFIEYFVKRDSFKDFSLLIDFCKAFLSKGFDSQLTLQSDLESIQNHYYQIFISIVRLTFACVAPNIEKPKSFDFFALLNENERQHFIKYTTFGSEALDCLKICSFSNQKLDGIFLGGTNLRGKSIKHSSIRHAYFTNADIAGAYLLYCDFTLSIFDSAYCHNADFSESILFGCSFKCARLNGVNFSNANLSYADLRGAILTKCKFDGANLLGAKISVEQLRDIYSFDIAFIRENKIEVYLDDCPLPDELLLDEFRKQRPVAYALHFGFGDRN